jgi:hypothetical protein
MCYSSNLFYVLYFNFYAIFLKFIVYTTDSEMVKSEIVILTRREKFDVTNADMSVSWMLWASAVWCWSTDDREKKMV